MFWLKSNQHEALEKRLEDEMNSIFETNHLAGFFRYSDFREKKPSRGSILSWDFYFKTVADQEIPFHKIKLSFILLNFKCFSMNQV